MTSISFTIRLSHSEAIMMESAMELMIKYCEENIEAGKAAPFISHKNSAENVLLKLCNPPSLNSTNNFFDLL